MDAEVKTGGPAFPQSIREEDGSTTYYHGLSVRDYFAAKAMQGELACQCVGESWHDIEKLAEHCYNLADAMLRAREGK